MVGRDQVGRPVASHFGRPRGDQIARPLTIMKTRLNVSKSEQQVMGQDTYTIAKPISQG